VLAVVVAEGLAIVLLTVLVLGLLRSHALILRALHELGAGLELERRGASSAAGEHRHEGGVGPVPVDLDTGIMPATRASSVQAAPLVGTTLDAQEVTIAVHGADRRTLVAFLSSGCSVCQTFWDELSAGVPDVPGDGRLVVVTKGPHEESSSRLRELAGPSLEVVQSDSAWTGYGVPGSPYFVYVEDGVITGEGSSTTWAQVRDLMSQAVADAADARRRAGRTGPGRIGADPAAGTVRMSPAGLDPLRDYGDLARVDRELLGAGIHPGHQSLFVNPSPSDDESPGAS
jgi:hypothetical protein